MYPTFRQSMAWLHTWFGLVLGFVLMACFFFGALSVFDREIDRWAIPETRIEPQPLPSFDAIVAPAMRALKPDPESRKETQKRVIGEIAPSETLRLSSFWAYTTHRDPVLAIGGEFDISNQPKNPADDHLHIHGYATIDPRTGATLSDSQLKVGSQFFYPMHFSLHLRWLDLGYWIVGLAALAMLAALVSGVVIHRKIFREFFTFRPHKRTQRSALDLHNLTGVVALPFHFFFALTGLIIFAGIYLPVGHTMLKPQHDADEIREAVETGLPHEASGVTAPLAPVDAMIATAKRRWAERGMPGEVGFLSIEHLGDANSYVSIYRAGSDRVALVSEGIHFKASTGELLREDPPRTPIFSVNEFLTGLHLQHFEHWLLRWFYFAGGLLGCVCIATGFIFFVEKRKRQHAAHGKSGARWVDALAVTAVTGMVIATLAILLANRLLPTALPMRGDWQERVFWLAWLTAAVHAAWRTNGVAEARLAPAWAEQCLAIAILGAFAVAANWATTGDHLVRTVANGYWPVAGVDVVLLAASALAVVAARKLRRRASATTAQQSVPRAEIVHA